MDRSLLAPLFVALASGVGCNVGFASMTDVRVDKRVERVETVGLDFSIGSTLTLDTRYGDIKVEAADGAQPELRATIHASGRTVEEAQAVLARYSLEVTQGLGGPVVRLTGEPLLICDTSSSLHLSAHADFTARVPAGTALVASSGSGDIETTAALGACKVETSYGSIAIGDARGPLVAKSGSGDVGAKRIDAGDESVTLRSSYGDVTLDEARAKTVACETGSGNVRVGTVTAEKVELVTSYGDVHARAAGGAVRARSGSGDVHLAGLRGAVDAESSYGTVAVDGVLERLQAESGSGNVTARAREGSRPASAWKLRSSYGKVVLQVPEGFACVLDARTSYGSVECDFPVTIEAGKRKDNHLKGTIGGGGETVTLSSGSGDVALEKL